MLPWTIFNLYLAEDGILCIFGVKCYGKFAASGRKLDVASSAFHHYKQYLLVELNL